MSLIMDNAPEAKAIHIFFPQGVCTISQFKTNRDANMDRIYTRTSVDSPGMRLI